MIKKSNKLTFFIVIFIFQAFNSIISSESEIESPSKAEAQLTPEQEKEIKAQGQEMAKRLNKFLAILRTTSQQRQLNKQDIKDFLLFVLLFPVPVSTFIHELGHNLVDMILYKHTNLNIHLGAEGRTEEALTHIIKYPGITIHSFEPSAGFYVEPKGKQESKIKDLLMTMAGPIFGILSYLTFKKIIVDKIKGSDNTFVKWYILNCIKFIVSMFFNKRIFHEALYGFTPFYTPGGDGYQIWELLGVSKEKLNKLYKFESETNIIKSFFTISMYVKFLLDMLGQLKNKSAFLNK